MNGIVNTPDQLQLSRALSASTAGAPLPPASNVEDTRPRVLLPKGGQTLSKFAQELGRVIGPTQQWFVKSNRVVVVERARLSDRVTTTVFTPLTAIPLRTAVEKYVCLGSWNNQQFQPGSITREAAAAVLESDQFKAELPVNDRILDVPVPMLLDGAIVYPTKGYDPRFKTYCPMDAPSIEPMSLADAKALIAELHQDFCFADETSLVVAIARMLTPMCRGLMGFDARTPLWIFEANRPRSGKDYLAGCTSVLYEGFANEDAPLDADPAETGKRITSALQSGRRFMHFANCEGYARNSALEHAVTASVYRGRKLGSNDGGSDLQLVNEIEFSLSANTGFQYSEDLDLRSRKISLSYSEENGNTRVFTKPDLHDWIRRNRGRLLSAMAALIAEWDRQGRPSGTTPFASFPKWAEVIGGICVACGLGDPCVHQTQTSLTGDALTDNMKQLYALAHERYGDREIDKAKLQSIVQEAGLFAFFDLANSRSHQTLFGNKLRAFHTRELGGIQMMVNSTTSRPTYKFSKQVMKRDAHIVTKLMQEPSKGSETANLANLENLFLAEQKHKSVIGVPEVHKVNEVRPSDDHSLLVMPQAPDSHVTASDRCEIAGGVITNGGLTESRNGLPKPPIILEAETA